VTREELLGALRDVGNALQERGTEARLYVVGGAWMVLTQRSREITMDVDGDFYPREILLEISRAVAHDRGLPAHWLNAAANAFIPVFRSPEWKFFARLGSLELWVADQRTMLAMKLRASRGRRDENDIRLLLQLCDVDTLEQAQSLYHEFYPEDPAPSRAWDIVTFLLAQRS